MAGIATTGASDDACTGESRVEDGTATGEPKEKWTADEFVKGVPDTSGTSILILLSGAPVGGLIDPDYRE